MNWISTRDPARRVDLRTAVVEGLARDGGLYLPENLPRLEPGELRDLAGTSFQESARRLSHRLLDGSLDRRTVDEVATTALDFPVPLVPLDETTWVAELFHGPTGSFKDFGARFLARLLSVLRPPDADPVTILVATSGDTGGAVADAVRGLPGVDAVVLFPRGRLSPVQLRQLGVPTPLRAGSGAVPVEVDGTFDDCQRMVKDVLTRPGPGVETLLTSANSVNVGRLLPQAFYYVHARARLREAASLLVSVPSGNLGNLTGGLLALRMGAPLDGFVAASNANGAMGRFLETGRPPDGPLVETLSSAMDVARPSNLERVIALFGGDLDGIRARVHATRHEDDEVLAAMRAVDREAGYLLDPHTAVAYLGLRERREAGVRGPGLILATADPAKFPETVTRATGRPPPTRPDWEEAPRSGEEGGGSGGDPPVPGGDPAVRMAPDPEALRALLRDR